jgi:ornithine--oxo-acid transaminase
VSALKLLLALSIIDSDCDWIERSFDAVVSGAHRVPGAVWTLGKTLLDNAVRMRARG